MYSTSNRHVCMLPKQPECLQYPPTAGALKQLVCRLRLLAQPASWHSGTATYIRSNKALTLERTRQANGPCCILHPYSAIRFYWDIFQLIVGVVCFVYAPFQVFVRCPNPLDPLLLFCDLVALLDIVLNFVTGAQTTNSDEHHIELEPRAIAKLYIKHGFIWDLISALPLQVIQPYPYECIYITHTMFLIFKLFRLRGFCCAWNTFCKQIDMTYVSAMATTVILRLILFGHWLTYFHYQIICICKHQYEDSEAFKSWIEELHLNTVEASLVEQYIVNLYRVSGICLGTGAYNATRMRLIEEIMLEAIYGIFGLVILVHSLTALFRLILYSHYGGLHMFSGRHQQLKEFLRFKRASEELRRKVDLFLDYKYHRRHCYNEPHLMETINDQIKQEINMFSCKRLVVAVPLFKDLPPPLINAIIFSLTQVLYMPGDTIVKLDEPADSLYLLASGTVAVMDSEGTEVTHLTDGACWGERALLQPGDPRTFSVLALEITEIYK